MHFIFICNWAGYQYCWWPEEITPQGWEMCDQPPPEIAIPAMPGHKMMRKRNLPPSSRRSREHLASAEIEAILRIAGEADAPAACESCVTEQEGREVLAAFHSGLTKLRAVLARRRAAAVKVVYRRFPDGRLMGPYKVKSDAS